MNSFLRRFIFAIVVSVAVIAMTLVVGDRSIPRVISVDADTEDGFVDPLSSFIFRFSEPVTQTFLENITFLPTLQGDWKLLGRRAIFTPKEPLDFTSSVDISLPTRVGFFGLSQKKAYYSFKTHPLQITFLGETTSQKQGVYFSQWPQKQHEALTEAKFNVIDYDIAQASGVFAFLAHEDADQTVLFLQAFTDQRNAQKLPLPPDFLPKRILLSPSADTLVLSGELLNAYRQRAVFVLKKDSADWIRFAQQDALAVAFISEDMVVYTTYDSAGLFRPSDLSLVRNFSNNVVELTALVDGGILKEDTPLFLGTTSTEKGIDTTTVVLLSEDGAITPLSEQSFHSFSPAVSFKKNKIAFVANYDPTASTSAPLHILGYDEAVGTFNLSDAENDFVHLEPAFSPFGHFLSFKRCEASDDPLDTYTNTLCPLYLVQTGKKDVEATSWTGRKVRWLLLEE